QAEVEHPLRLALVVADLFDDALGEALLGLEEVVLRQTEAVLLRVPHPLQLRRVGVQFVNVGHACLRPCTGASAGLVRWVPGRSAGLAACGREGRVQASGQAPTASRIYS